MIVVAKDSVETEVEEACDNALAQLARERRQKLQAENTCINGPLHGPPMPGRIRCHWCVWVHRHGVAAVLKMKNAPTPPPGYVVRRPREQR